ncbi:CLUMA_CG015207, isoform A [Clunio marinus]|uniref:CLUMA_CG015207, isoform A n=1 Tax=Clunio marinus TaxID=568069 RepID=A0A1J1ITL2_9DIPT|nr:CLUMA_CG015207, isoform A [Clunio marinus]
MGSSNMMNGMNFFNLNTTTTPPSLFGSSTATSNTYKDSCKYVSPHDDEEVDNEDDNERLLSGSSNHLSKSNSNNTNSYNDRSNERASHVTGEDSTN